MNGPNSSTSASFDWIDTIHRVDLLASTIAAASVLAIHTGHVVAVLGLPLLIVPDVLVVEWTANAEAVPDGWDGPPMPPPPGTMFPVGDDGRTAATWRLDRLVEVGS